MILTYALGADVAARATGDVTNVGGPAPMTDSPPLAPTLLVTVEAIGGSVPPLAAYRGWLVAVVSHASSTWCGGPIPVSDVRDTAVGSTADVAHAWPSPGSLAVLPLAIASVLDTVARTL